MAGPGLNIMKRSNFWCIDKFNSQSHWAPADAEINGIQGMWSMWQVQSEWPYSLGSLLCATCVLMDLDDEMTCPPHHTMNKFPRPLAHSFLCEGLWPQAQAHKLSQLMYCMIMTGSSRHASQRGLNEGKWVWCHASLLKSFSSSLKYPFFYACGALSSMNCTRYVLTNF